ncbi:MAG TPA: hypothetical protein VEV44_06295 [Pseudoneobacillus sp.]|nr:hypothetical protein [Pseudoneobacillus sp.]
MSNFDNQIRNTLKEATKHKNLELKFEDVWNKTNRNTFILRKLFLQPLIPVTLAFCIVVPVTASFIKDWYNFSVVNEVDETSESVPTLPLEIYPEHIKSFKNITLDQAREKVDYIIMRPKEYGLPLEMSTATISTKGSIWIWDVFHSKDKWVVVKQDLNEDLQSFFHSKLKKTYELKPNEEVIELEGKEALLILGDEGSGIINLGMVVKQGDNLISFELKGNVSKENMIELAKTYH